ncbi:Hypothetical predicted protein [Lecanosticta acicola]|uniref:Pentatricopeptide repeat protein n=1 Tax=Lecanosticta acicola TaxID=111012 RepID=A0AAI8YYL9_9PEZI|nr:Hypothetical predicted protein [Lecanosticta acicola]
MPSCHLPFCSLLRSRSFLGLGRARALTPRWFTSSPRFSTVFYRSQRDEANPRSELDLSKLPAESAYLDFILGSPKEENASADAQPEREDRAHSEEAEGNKRPVTKRSTSRQRRAQKSRSSGNGKSSIDSTPCALKSGVEEERVRGSNAPDAASYQRGSKVPRPRLHISRPQASKHSWRVLVRYIKPQEGRDHATGQTTSWIRVKRTRESLRWFWNREFGKLRKRYNPSFGYEPDSLQLSLSTHAERWAKEILEEIGVQDDQDIPPDLVPSAIGLSRWQQIALWLLENEPRHMLAFLRYTHTSPYPPQECISNALWYLSEYFSGHDNSVMWQKEISLLVDLFAHLSKRDSLPGGERRRIRMFNSFFRNILQHCSEQEGREVYRAVKAHDVGLRWGSFLHFTTFFARNGQFEQALDALLEAKSRHAPLDSNGFLSNCATLLRSSVRQAGGLRVSLRIFDNLVSMGLALNVQLCNILMLNAVEAHDVNSAMSIYQSLVQHGLEADKYTFTILLKGCKADIDNAELLNTTIRSSIEHVDVLHSPVVALEILHCLALHHTKHNLDNSFQIVADALAQLFDVEPLEKIGIQLPNLSKPSHPGQPKLPLTPAAFGIILAVYLEHVFRRTRSNLTANELYQRYKAAADAQLEPFVSTVEEDYIFNTFLMSFIKTKKGLLYAAGVIKDMQSQKLGHARRCKPTVQTWSIFLHGFTEHKQMRLAEQVLNYMRSKGIEPNQVTWNILVTGYAAVQDVEGTLDAVRRMEADGATWDPWMMAGLRKLKDQTKFGEHYSSTMGMPQYDFTTDIKERLGERLSTPDEIELEEKKQDDGYGSALVGESER